MADKGFGVREIDLIGGDGGTPFIESPNNLNLNANTVGVSTNMTVGGTLSVGTDATNRTELGIRSIGIGTTNAAGRDAGINTAPGTLIYDTVLGLQVYTGMQWRTVAGTSVDAGGGAGGNMAIVVTSSDIANSGDVLGTDFNYDQGGCGGNNTSPQLTWTVSGANTDVASFRLRVTDEDSTPVGFIHWSVDGITAATGSIAQNGTFSGSPTINNTGWAPGPVRANGWGGACPPPGETHTYNIVITAHDAGGAAVTQDGVALTSNTLQFVRGN